MDLQIKDDAMIAGDVNVNIEAQKSEEQIKRENLNRYRAKCREVLADNIIEPRERAMLDALAGELHISKSEAQMIESSEASISKRKAPIDKVSIVILKQIIKKFKGADINGVAKLFTKLQGMNKAFDDEEVCFYHYLILSVFNPNDCIRQYESRSEDNYWQAYWTVMACLKQKKTQQAETIKSNLANWTDYEEENILLLEIAIALLNDDFDTAEALKEVIEATYSPALQDFAETLFLVLFSKDDYAGMEPEPHTIFYLDGIFSSMTGRNAIGVLQPDGTLASDAVAPKENNPKPVVVNVNIIKNSAQDSANTKACAMDKLGTVRFTREECERRSQLGWDEGGLELEEQQDGLYIIKAKQNDKSVYGLWDRTKQVLLLDIKYKEIMLLDENLYAYYIWDNFDWGLLNTETLMKTIHDDSNGFNLVDGYPYCWCWKRNERKQDVWALLNYQDGTYLLDAVYSEYKDGNYVTIPGYVLIKDLEGNWGVFDLNKKDIVAPCRYKKIQKGDDNHYFWLISDLSNSSHNLDVLVTGANVLYQKVEGGLKKLDMFPDIYILYKSADGPYAICNADRTDNVIELYDAYWSDWADDAMDQSQVTPLIFVEKNDMLGLLDAATGEMVLDFVYDEVDCDGIDGSPCVVLTRDGQKYTFNMFTRKFE